MDEFKDMVAKMRQKQKDYFKTRDSTVLRECKDWERRVDQALETPKPKEPDLFGGHDGG